MVVTFNITSVSLSAFIRCVVATMHRLQAHRRLGCDTKYVLPFKR